MCTLVRHLRSRLKTALRNRVETMATRQTRGKATKKSAEPPLRILCFGDSLTCGYPIGNPYAGRLAEMIEEAFPGRRVECEVEGLPGDLVTNGEYMPRMERSCKWPIT